MTGDYTQQYLDEADDGGQALHCPECGCYEFMVSQLATVGPTDQLGMACAECGHALAKTDVVDLVEGAREQLQK